MNPGEYVEDGFVGQRMYRALPPDQLWHMQSDCIFDINELGGRDFRENDRKEQISDSIC